MTQHTPGPWKHEAATKTIRSTRENYWIASMRSIEGSVNHEANARLIAAAPDLFGALQQLIYDSETEDSRNPEHPSITAAREAIAKATGKE